MSDQESEYSINAFLEIELNVECPSCGLYFDLLHHYDDQRGKLNEEGQMIRQACPACPDSREAENWVDSHKDFREIVTCSECGHVMKVKGICW